MRAKEVAEVEEVREVREVPVEEAKWAGDV